MPLIRYLFRPVSNRLNPLLAPRSLPHCVSIDTTRSTISRESIHRLRQSFVQLRKMSSAMSKRLEGKTVLITGASSGIGKSTALEFARTSPKSLKLILTARRIDALKALAAEIKSEVGDDVQCLPVQLDMTKPSEIVSFVANLPADFKDIDVLVNNAGMVKGVDKSPEIRLEDIDVMFATNVTGLIVMTQEVMKGMLKRGESGQGDIINLGSIAGREGYPSGSIYCATKAAVRTFTEALRKELIATRIRVIEIDPGQVETVSEIVARLHVCTLCSDPMLAGRGYSSVKLLLSMRSGC